jgi:hypothetical protein
MAPHLKSHTIQHGVVTQDTRSIEWHTSPRIVGHDTLNHGAIGGPNCPASGVAYFDENLMSILMKICPNLQCVQA